MREHKKKRNEKGGIGVQKMHVVIITARQRSTPAGLWILNTPDFGKRKKK